MKVKRKDTKFRAVNRQAPPSIVRARRQAWSQAAGPKVRTKERTPKQATRQPKRVQAVKHIPG